MYELALFAGAGGGILGGKLLGWRTICAVERDAYAAQVLAQRQNDGVLEPFPIWSDVTTFDGTAWNGIVDVVSGGFPCQDISAAGKGAGIEGARSGMWKEMARIISEVQPRYAFVENSPMLTTRGLGTVLADLASMGFDAEWGVLSAADVGAPHLRERIWIVAKQRNFLSHTSNNGNRWRKQRKEGVEEKADMANSNMRGHLHRQAKKQSTNSREYALSQFEPSMEHENDAYTGCSGFSTRAIQALRRNVQTLGEQSWRGFRSGDRYSENARVICGINDGMANRVDRLKAIGNGQVPLCAATAFTLLKDRLDND
jgi:DNA (cytosine-5)-methyltransferase 1